MIFINTIIAASITTCFAGHKPRRSGSIRSEDLAEDRPRAPQPTPKRQCRGFRED